MICLPLKVQCHYMYDCQQHAIWWIRISFILSVVLPPIDIWWWWKGGGVLYVVLGMGRVTLHIKFLKRSFIKVSYTKYSINSRELTTFENHTLECKTIGLIKESCFCANIFLIFKMACVAYITIMEFLRRGESITLGAIIGWRGRGALKHLCTITKPL